MVGSSIFQVTENFTEEEALLGLIVNLINFGNLLSDDREFVL